MSLPIFLGDALGSDGPNTVEMPTRQARRSSSVLAAGCSVVFGFGRGAVGLFRGFFCFVVARVCVSACGVRVNDGGELVRVEVAAALCQNRKTLVFRVACGLPLVDAALSQL